MVKHLLRPIQLVVLQVPGGTEEGVAPVHRVSCVLTADPAGVVMLGHVQLVVLQVPVWGCTTVCVAQG